ncbi:hypothetical protein U5A82_18360 [Sphingobium sp. CR2-8]|uniref:hypothetical protein n=1 Tax=Sphingobium sp. CR2-8 TaxID=1306534 RepID=UPI002DBBC7DA|nr:hypothetical protein [Sphingobium sp. CR2-8]MEC3912365.1 hypothetical protein [Sphingobium sp. CR2-8]
MSERKDPPIIEQEYLHGLKVVDIGDLRVARGRSRRPVSACKHPRMVYDGQERRIWCKDCETDIEPFDAFTKICENFHRAAFDIERRQEAVTEAEQHSILRIAAKQMDEHFRRKNMVPACPHCSAAIFPEDVPKMGSVNHQWEEAKRARKDKTQ